MQQQTFREKGADVKEVFPEEKFRGRAVGGGRLPKTDDRWENRQVQNAVAQRSTAA